MVNRDLIIDCDQCVAPRSACQDCIVSVLLASPSEDGFCPEEVAAVGVLADRGLVPPLRLVRPA